MKLTNKINEGLVHKIYRKNKVIFKVTKDEFEEFNNQEHFLIEKFSLDLLKTWSLPTAKVNAISYDTNTKKYVLIEEFINGRQFDKKKLNRMHCLSILNLLDEVHLITLSNYGLLKPNGIGTFKTWKEYLSFVFLDSLDFLEKNKILDKQIFKEIVKIVNLSKINFREKGSFLLFDLNPLNLFFDKQNKIIGVIDVDHPIVGDPLFDYASIKWYHQKIFREYLLVKKPKPEELEIIKIYELIIGFFIIKWNYSHSLNCKSEVKKIQKRIKDFN